MIHATLDDVGSCAADGMCAVVGYVAYKPQWDKFNWRWQVSLAQLKLPFLHTSKYLNQFPLIGGDGITDDDVYTILSPFVRIVHEELIRDGGFGICVITECDAYYQLTEGEKKYVREPSLHSFEMAAALACFSVRNELNLQDCIVIEMDEGQNAPALYARYQALKVENDTLRNHLGAICFCDDKMHYPVQAADMLGNITLKAWRSWKARKEWSKAFKELVFPDGISTVTHRIYGVEALKELASLRISKKNRMVCPEIPE